LVVDERLAKKGASVKLPGFDGVFTDRLMRFQASDECAYLQLADFVVSRSQCVNCAVLTIRGPLPPLS